MEAYLGVVPAGSLPARTRGPAPQGGGGHVPWGFCDRANDAELRAVPRDRWTELALERTAMLDLER